MYSLVHFHLFSESFYWNFPAVKTQLFIFTKFYLLNIEILYKKMIL